MENQDNLQSGYKVINIFLMDSIFNRISQVTFEAEKLKPVLNIDIKTNFDNNKIIVSETLVYESIVNNIKEVTATITMLGVFEKFGDSPSVSPTDFGNINGPAIIYPFIREHLSSLSLKAGIGQLLIPPVNFVKKTQEEKGAE